MGQHDPARRQATDRLDAGQDVAQDRGQQVARGLGVLAEQHGGRITEPAADEPGGVGGVGRGAAGGELPGDEGVGVAAVDDGGDGGRPVPEGDHLDAAVVVGDRRGDGGPPEVDPEDMGHGVPLPPRTSPRIVMTSTPAGAGPHRGSHRGSGASRTPVSRGTALPPRRAGPLPAGSRAREAVAP